MPEKAHPVVIDKNKYEHLDNGRLEVFLSEFLYRNEKFLKDYWEIMEKDNRSLDDQADFFRKYGCFPAIQAFRNKPSRETRPVVWFPATRVVRILPKGSQTKADEAAGQSATPRRVPTFLGLDNRHVGDLLHSLFYAETEKGEYAVRDSIDHQDQSQPV